MHVKYRSVFESPHCHEKFAVYDIVVLVIKSCTESNVFIELLRFYVLKLWNMLVVFRRREIHQAANVEIIFKVYFSDKICFNLVTFLQVLRAFFNLVW